MNTKTVIPAFYKGNLSIPETVPYLEISELYQSIQGEGFYIGCPCYFLRMQKCTLDCIYCDTKKVYQQGNPYTFEEIFDLLDAYDVIDDLRWGHHLVITGGSPLRQQNGLALFFAKFQYYYGFVPFIEVENECTILPTKDFSQYVSVWNNSPKLSGSGNVCEVRYKPEIIRDLAQREHSWFKFVIDKYSDWDEIYKDFLVPDLLSDHQIILMPLGATKEELEQRKEVVIQIALDKGVRYSPRLHIEYWGKKIGI